MNVSPGMISGRAVAAKRGGMREVQLVRHGATSLNNEDISVDRIRGWKDVPLSKSGHEQAEILAKKMRMNPPDVLVTSNLKRSHDTAEIISKRIGIPIAESSNGLRPWNVGDYAGSRTSEALPVLQHYACDLPEKKIPGGESFDEFSRRLFTYLADVFKRYPDGVIALVTHHRVERRLHAWLAAGAPTDGGMDKSVFNRKGDPTGHLMVVRIPTAQLPWMASKSTGSASNKKENKDEVDYQNSPRGSQHCSGCTMFREPSSCSAVNGTIAAHGWCKLFQAKSRNDR